MDLDLGANEIWDEGAKALKEALEQSSTLTDLNLEGNWRIDSATKEAIEHLLQSRKMVQVPTSTQEDKEGEEGAQSSPEAFHLAKPRIKALAQALQQSSTLTELDLEHNNLGDEGAKALAQAVEQNSTLTGWYLASNNIGDEGAKALAEDLQQNSTLRDLHLAFNSIGLEGAKALAEGLKQNSTLTKLVLMNNNIGDEGAKALAEALQQNSTLRDLHLAFNSIGLEGAKALAEAVQQNSILMNLDLNRNNIGDEGAKALEMIKEALRRNIWLEISPQKIHADEGDEGTEELRRFHESECEESPLNGTSDL